MSGALGSFNQTAAPILFPPQEQTPFAEVIGGTSRQQMIAVGFLAVSLIVSGVALYYAMRRR